MKKHNKFFLALAFSGLLLSGCDFINPNGSSSSEVEIAIFADELPQLTDRETWAYPHHMTNESSYHDSESSNGEQKRIIDLVNYHDGFTLNISSGDDSYSSGLIHYGYHENNVTHEYLAQGLVENPEGTWSSNPDEAKLSIDALIHHTNLYARSAWNDFGFAYKEMNGLKGQEDIDKVIEHGKQSFSSDADVTVEFVKAGDRYIFRGYVTLNDEEEGLLEYLQVQTLKFNNGRPGFFSDEIIQRSAAREIHENTVIEFTYLDTLPNYSGPKKPN